MRNNTRKGSARRRLNRSPQPELQWLEDGVHTFVKALAGGIYSACLTAANAVDRLTKQQSTRR